MQKYFSTEISEYPELINLTSSGLSIRERTESIMQAVEDIIVPCLLENRKTCDITEIRDITICPLAQLCDAWAEFIGDGKQ